MAKNLRERAIGATGSVSGAASILGSWQVCHSVCLGIISALSLVGITVAGMPLLFLTKIALPAWTIALVLLIATVLIYLKKMCISRNLIIINSGLIVAGVPFQQVQQFSKYFLLTGGVIAAAGIYLLIKERISRKKSEMKKRRK